MKHDGLNLREPSPVLGRDPWFWGALLLGAAVCEGLALHWGLGERIRIHVGQWRELLWLVVIYPFAEEWLFRGMLQPQLLRLRYGRLVCCRISGANMMASVLFAALHLFAHAPLWAMLVFIPSLLFGAFRDRYDSILPAILLHASYNLSYFALFGLER